MKFIGAHVSAAGGVENTPHRAAAIGADAFSLFVKNQKRWSAPPFKEGQPQSFKKALQKSGISPENVIPHAGYLINLAHPDKDKRQKSLDAMVDEVLRVEELGLTFINVHPGSHLNITSRTEALQQVAKSLDWIMEQTSTGHILLENTAGQGTNLGYQFEELARILDHCRYPERAGICIDSCHAYSAGYNLADPSEYNRAKEEMIRLWGPEKVRAFHVNDSLNPLGSRKDRHEQLGKGTLGWKAFENLMTDPLWEDRPFILETRQEDLWAEEIRELRRMSQQNADH